MKSWKTTLAGALGALGIYFATNSTGTLKVVGEILSGAGTFLLGMWARDNNVTSEQAGVK